MPLKALIDNLESVEEADRKYYKAGDGGKFVLDVDGFDDHPGLGALKRARDHEKDAKVKAQQKVTELTAEVEKLTTDLQDVHKGAVPKGDVDRLEASYKEQAAKLKKEGEEKVAALRAQVDDLLVNNVAQGLSTKMVAKPEYAELMLPHVRARLKAEEVDGKLVTRVLDRDGKPTALTVEDLEKELFTSKAFAGILAGSKSSGSGASGGSGGGGATKKLSDLSEVERRELAKSNPQEWQRVLDEAKGAANGVRG